MSKDRKPVPESGRGSEKAGAEELAALGGMFGGLGALIEKLGVLAEKGRELRESRDEGSRRCQDALLPAARQTRGVVGFSIKVGLGDKEVEVERFGNVGKDEKTGAPVVHAVREPLVDVFDETDHLLLVAEMPGIAEEDIQLDLKEDVLAITAERKDVKYHKEVLLPASYGLPDMSRTCHNGILEIRFAKRSGKIGGPVE